MLLYHSSTRLSRALLNIFLRIRLFVDYDNCGRDFLGKFDNMCDHAELSSAIYRTSMDKLFVL